MRGWYAVCYDGDGPIQTGIGSYATKEEAIPEAQSWAKCEELECDYPLVNENLTKNKTMSEELKVTSIKRLLDKDDFTNGDNVKRIKGKITALYNANKGDDYEYQNGEFTGEDGSKIRICFSKCSQPSSAKNKTVMISSVSNDQQGWLGIKVLDKEHDGKKQRELRIVPSAIVEYIGGPNGSSSDSPKDKTTGEKTEGRPAPERKGSQDHPRPLLEDMVELHFDVATLVAKRYGKESFEVVAPFIATVFIEAAKNGLAYDYKNRASKPVPVKYPPAPKDYSLWKECVMPWGKEGVIGKKLSELSEDKLREIHIYFDEKGINTDLAECVYQAARDLNLFKQKEKAEQEAADNAALDAAPDDIPF